MKTITAIIAAILAGSTALAQTPSIPTYAAKTGETIDLGPIYWVNNANCQSLAIAKSDVEMLEGPIGLKFEVKEGLVVPTAQGCKNKIQGGHLMLTVPEDIEAANAHVTLRIIHHDRNGPQNRAYIFNLVIVH